MATAPVKIVPRISPPVEFSELSLRLRPRLRVWQGSQLVIFTLPQLLILALTGTTTCDILHIFTYARAKVNISRAHTEGAAKSLTTCLHWRDEGRKATPSESVKGDTPRPAETFQAGTPAFSYHNL